MTASTHPAAGTPATEPPPLAAAAVAGDDYDALLQFLYLAPVGLVQIGRSGDIAMMNPLSSLLLMPLARGGDLTNLFTALEGVAPDLRHRIAAFEPPYGLVCDGVQLPVGGAAGPGGPEPQTLSISLLKLDDTRLMAVLSDVTEQVRRERLLRQNQAWLSAILDDIRDHCLVVLDADGRIDDWNPSIGRVTGFSREQVIGQPFSMFYPDADRDHRKGQHHHRDHGGHGAAAAPERLRDLLREADARGWSIDDGWRRRADGSRFWCSSLLSSLNATAEATSTLTAATATAAAPAQAGYCMVMRDITGQQEADDRDRRAASSDPLTGLANRRSFFEAAEVELARARRSGRPVSLVLVDADRLRQINLEAGEPAGDAVLRHLGSLLTATFGATARVSRIGGEEFAALLPATDLQSAVDQAEQVCQAVRAAGPLAIAGREQAYTVSAGVACGHGPLLAFDDLVRRAERALQQAKADGRNRVACSAAA